MSYKEIQDYLEILRGQSKSAQTNVQVDWNVVDPKRITSVDHSKLARLQVADAVASSFHFAITVNRYGETEPNYLYHLKNAIYRHKGVGIGYGIKVWPEDFDTIKSKAPEATNLEGL